MRRTLGISVAVALAIVAVVAAIGVGVRKTRDAPAWVPGSLKAPRETGEIVFLTLRGPTATEATTRAGASGETLTGFEHDLATLFAAELGLRPTFVVLPSYQDLLKAIDEGRGHIAAAGISLPAELRARYVIGPRYHLTQQVLVYRAAEPKPRTLKDAEGKKIAVIAETPTHDLLRELTGSYPALALDVLPRDAHADDLLRRVASGESAFAVSDAYAFSIGKRTYPKLASAFNIGPQSRMAWVFSAAADFEMQQKTVLFFEKISNNGTLNRLLDRYYGTINRLQASEAESILDKIERELPKLRAHFHEAQQLSGIDWRMLAAVGYQESHWNPLATSPTGVRGLMMLTEETADRLKVKNRLDARESILGGARYLALLRDTVPARITEPDRTWMALAAYNQGYAHLEDARILAARLKLNPDVWPDVRKMYPKLTEPAHYETLKHGYCRGEEAVQFVENVRGYSDMLMKIEKPLDSEIRYDLVGDVKRTAPGNAREASRK